MSGKIFISWSGTVSSGIATVLKEHLPLLIPGPEIFLSSEDIETGTDWRGRVAAELGDSTYGLFVLEPGNWQSTWINFEAGAISRHEKARVSCILFDGLRPAQVTGPLSAFNHILFDESQFRKLLSEIDGYFNGGTSSANLTKLIDKFWPDIELAVGDCVEAAPNTVPKRRSTEEILEEVLERVRNLERQVQVAAALGENVGRETRRETLDDAMYRMEFRRRAKDYFQKSGLSGNISTNVEPRSITLLLDKEPDMAALNGFLSRIRDRFGEVELELLVNPSLESDTGTTNRGG